MAYYGITNKNQIIDFQTIKTGCNDYRAALDTFVNCGVAVFKAAEMCDKKALSVDYRTLQDYMADIGEQIIKLRETYGMYAVEVANQAVMIAGEQVAELKEYQMRLAQDQSQEQNI